MSEFYVKNISKIQTLLKIAYKQLLVFVYLTNSNQIKYGLILKGINENVPSMNHLCKKMEANDILNKSSFDNSKTKSIENMFADNNDKIDNNQMLQDQKNQQT